MSFVKNTQPQRTRNASKRVLLGETREEEAARLEREIAAHPVTRCEPGTHNPSSSRPGWDRKHSAFRAERRRGDREEDDAEALNGILISLPAPMLPGNGETCVGEQ